MSVNEHLRANPIYLARYPNIHLDTFAYCNAKCVFCGYPHMTREKGQMSRELLDHIAKDLSTWEVPMEEIVPIYYGEFFLNPDWLYVLQYLQDNVPETKVSIPTNGSALDDAKIDQLLKIKNIYWLNFSIYGYFDDTYERLMGLPASTIGKVRHAVDRIHKERPDIAIVVCTCSHPPFITEYERRLFMEYWSPFANAHVLIGNRQMNKQAMKTYPSSVPCMGFFQSINILWDGRVCLCCYDPNGEIIVGNVWEQSLMEIWQGKTRHYQELHARGRRDEIPLCSTCTSG